MPRRLRSPSFTTELALGETMHAPMIPPPSTSFRGRLDQFVYVKSGRATKYLDLESSSSEDSESSKDPKPSEAPKPSERLESSNSSGSSYDSESSDIVFLSTSKRQRVRYLENSRSSSSSDSDPPSTRNRKIKRRRMSRESSQISSPSPLAMSKRAPKSDRGFPVKLSNSSTAKSSAAESSSSAASRVEVRIPKAGSDSPPQHLPRPSNSESASPAPIRAEIRIPARPVTASTRILQPSPTRLSSVPIARLPREPTPPANELPPLTDAIAPNLLVLFVGHNPGLKSSQKGHAYSSPSNWFWRLLHKSGCTPYKLMPEEDQTLPSQFGLGNTNIVARPTRSTSKLDKSEFLEGAAILEEKIRRFRPEVVCLVGKGIWDSICEAKNIERQRRGLRKWTAKNKHMGADFRHGWQVGEARTLGSTEGWDGAKTFVATSTSGLERTPKERKLEIWAPLGEFVQRRRRERGEWLVD